MPETDEMVEMMSLRRNNSIDVVEAMMQSRQKSEWDGVQNWRASHRTDMTYSGPDATYLLTL